MRWSRLHDTLFAKRMDDRFQLWGHAMAILPRHSPAEIISSAADVDDKAAAAALRCGLRLALVLGCYSKRSFFSRVDSGSGQGAMS